MFLASVTVVATAPLRFAGTVAREDLPDYCAPSMPAKDLRERFGEMGANRIVSRELSQGDSTDMIREMFGEPDGVSTHVYKAKAQETWKYWRMGAHVYGLQIKIENDACVGWTTS